jgi:hypothetical protein
MAETPHEQHGPPPEEQVDPADAADRLEQDPERVPNAPNRPMGDAPDADESPHEAEAGRRRSRDADLPSRSGEQLPPDPPH